jgi:hypothetical protein
MLAGLAEVPYQHEVSLRIMGTAEQVRARLPAGLATIEELPAGPAQVRVRLRVQRLDWVPSLLAWLDRPFVIEHPDALRDHVHALAHRLTASADDVPGAAQGPGGPGPRRRPDAHQLTSRHAIPLASGMACSIPL